VRLIEEQAPDITRLEAESVPHALRIAMPKAELAAALGLSTRRYDWTRRQGQRALLVDNPGARRFTDGLNFEHEFDDGDVRLASGAPGELSVAAGQRPEPRLLMPRSFLLLTGQQWARGGALPVHAAALVIDGRGVLVLGQRGAGKSVLGLAAVAAGHGLVSDDWLLLAPDGHGQSVVERMREFFMLRQGWAADRLLQRLSDLPFSTGTRPKTAFRLENRSDVRFPVAARIDEVWLLKRPRAGRAERSTARPMPASAALAAIMEASIALLFSQSFPHERRAVLATLNALLARTPARLVTTGTDLVETPARALSRLLSRQYSSPA